MMNSKKFLFLGLLFSASILHASEEQVDELVDAVRFRKSEEEIQKILATIDVKNPFDKSDGLTPLHFAARAGSTPVVKMFLDRGANVNACSNSSNTALHLAVRMGPLDRVGADQNNVGGADLIEVLLQRGASPFIGNLHGNTPLHAAAKSSDVRSIKTLLEKFTEETQKRLCGIRNIEGHTPYEVYKKNFPINDNLWLERMLPVDASFNPVIIGFLNK